MDIKISIDNNEQSKDGFVDSVQEYISHLKKIIQDNNYQTPEASILVPTDVAIREQVEKAVVWAQNDVLKYLIVIGIGGSNLGTQAIIESLGSQSGVDILFLDTTSEYIMKKCFETLDNNISDKKELLINVISKSGSTTETMANFEVLYSYVTERFGNSADRVVATTDDGSALWSSAIDNGFYALGIPQSVGGRYSVFTSVGLFPLMIAGIDIDALLQGAQNARNMTLKDSVEENYAVQLASTSYSLYKEGYSVHNSFFFEPRLETLGKWWRQLVGESLGKQDNLRGESIGVGIIPIISIGSVDLHSVGQLYLSGAQKIYTTFIKIPEEIPFSIPVESATFLGKQLGGKTFYEITKAIYTGVVTAYKKKRLPLVEISFNSLNEYELGYYMQLKMMEIIFTAHLLDINAFDQPNVEDYKKETRKLLG